MASNIPRTKETFLFIERRYKASSGTTAWTLGGNRKLYDNKDDALFALKAFRENHGESWEYRLNVLYYEDYGSEMFEIFYNNQILGTNEKLEINNSSEEGFSIRVYGSPDYPCSNQFHHEIPSGIKGVVYVLKLLGSVIMRKHRRVGKVSARS